MKIAYLCSLKKYRSVKIKQVLSALERFAPLPLQESWDNAGLQLGLTEAEVSGALLCLDVNEPVVDEAIDRGCNLIVSHHPLLFRGLKQITGGTMVERCVIKAIKHDVVIVSMHTNMDNAMGGVNWKMAEKLGLTGVSFLAPLSASDPLQAKVEAGSGVVGELPEAMETRAFVELVKKQFTCQCAQCNELLRRPVRKVALCGGAGDFLLPDAVRLGADAFITGEMHYHQYFGMEQQIQICVIGHYESEQWTAEIFRDIIQRECPGVRCEVTANNTNPINYM